MATAISPPPQFDRAAANHRVRHPLERLRGYIRFYVAVEATCLLFLYLALWFWIGLLLDYGVFKAFTIDWVQELKEWSWGLPFRAGLLGVLVAGLLAVVAVKMLLRLWREFQDSALALVLERRFPQLLGDRLITAVELAEPKLADKYGFSQPMIEKTIDDAAQRVDQLALGEVFNWGRLWRAGALVAGLTVGLGLLVMVGGSLLAQSRVGEAAGNLREVAGIWCERHLLLANTLWPRRAHLELVDFPASGELRVGRDSPRPILRVRAAKWVVADAASPDGWRALRWSELQRPELLGDEAPAPDLLPAAWFLEVVRKNGMVDEKRLETALNQAAGQLALSGEPLPLAHFLAAHKLMTLDQATALLNHWTVDQVELQLARDQREERHALRPGVAAKLDEIFVQLHNLVGDSGNKRRLRALIVPDQVVLDYKGVLIQERPTLPLQDDNEYSFDFTGLKESIRFTVHGEDYYTAAQRITLVPPPTLLKLKRREERPLYLYERFPAEGAINDLKNQKRVFDDLPPILVTGETSRVDEIPAGTNIELTAEADKDLSFFRLAPATKTPAGKAPSLFEDAVITRVDERTFRVRFANVTNPLDFLMEFGDSDGVVGRRHVVIEPRQDTPPEVKVLVEVIRKNNQGQYLITPSALIPWSGEVRDDNGLNLLNYVYSFKRVESATGTGVRASTLTLSGLRFLPSALGPDLLALAFVGLAQADKATTTGGNGVEPLATFARRWKASAPQLIKEHLLDRDLARDVKEESPEFEAFDVERRIRGLKVTDDRAVQPHYDLQLFLLALDNNADTGPLSRESERFRFLVVSENELQVEIGKEEENLHDKLEKAVNDLKETKENSMVKILRDLPLLKEMKEFGIMALRVREVEDVVVKSEEKATEVLRDYRRILNEMKANRVNKQMVSKVEEICQKLADILDSGRGEAALVKEPLGEVVKLLETAGKADLKTAELAAKRLQALIDALDRILDKMGEITTINKLITQLVEISKAEQNEYERLKALKEKIEIKLLEDALNPPDKPKK